MKVKFSPILALIIAHGSITVAFSQTLIRGRVVDADSNAVPFATVRLPGLSATQANQRGYFEFRMTSKAAKEFYLKSGVDLYITVEKEGMVMLEPPDQKIRLPHNPDIQPQFRLVMVKKGSPLLARSERMLEYILREKIHAAVEAKEQELARRDVLAEEAQRLGLSKETLLKAVIQYKDRLRTSTDLNLRGLAALDDANEATEFKIKQQKLAEARDNFREAIQEDERDMRKGREAEARLPGAYYNLGFTFFNEARYDSALAFFTKANGAAPNDAEKLNMLGRVLQELAEYDRALAIFQRAFAIESTTHGRNHPNVAKRLNNISGVMQAKGDYRGALEKYQEALRIFEKFYGHIHPNVAATLNNIAGVFLEQANYSKAFDKYYEALQINVTLVGYKHPNVATCLNNIAAVLKMQANYAEAVNMLREALRIDEGYFGRNHPNVAIGLNNIAEVFRAQGNYAEALTKYEEALAIFEKFFGREHPYVATVLNNIALVLDSQDDYDGALVKYNEALAIVEKAFGRSHPYVAATLNNIAGVLESKVDYDGALLKYKEALAISEKFGNQAMVGTLYNNLGSAHKLKKDWPQARQWLEKSLSHNRALAGDSAAVLAYTYFHLAGVAQAEGQTHLSREYAQKSLALAERHKLAEVRAEVEAMLKQKR